MKKHILWHAFVTVALALVGLAQEKSDPALPEPFRSFVAEAQKRVAEFPELPVTTKPGKAEIASHRLDSATTIHIGEHTFSCVRFKTPPGKALDMVWAFSVPSEWAHWYILPAEGTMRGFRNWLSAQLLYEGLPSVVDNPAYLQTLSADELRPDTTYILWFKQKTPGKAPATLHAALGFFPEPSDGEWDAEKIEVALGLRDAPATQQASYLGGRGVKALLDPRFFEQEYGAGRIESVIWSRRHSRTTAGGFFIEMKQTIPPCLTEPALADLQATYGEADLVLTPAQAKLFHQEGQEIHFYDYIGFVIGTKNKKRCVLNVITQGKSTAGFRAESEGLTWSESPLPDMDLRIFFRDRQEIARVAYWGQANARVLSGELPAETFSKSGPAGREELKHLGAGVWEYQAFYEDGQKAASATLRQMAYDGVRYDYFPNGKPSAEIPYRAGVIEGKLKQWSDDGRTREVSFKNGRPFH